MFLDSGDGVVFKGDVGPWYNPDYNTFHLLRDSAERLVALAIKAYREKNNDTPPTQLFIHGKTRFNEDEIAGFKAAGGQLTQVIAVRITNEADLRLFRTGRDPIMRGMAWRAEPNIGYLWTRGYVPRLQTYPLGQKTFCLIVLPVEKGSHKPIGLRRLVICLCRVRSYYLFFVDRVL